MSFNTIERIRKGFWFGTEERMEWFQTPLAGADTSPTGWNTSGTTLNGGGFELNSFGSHKLYRYEWSNNSAREVAQKMKSYADGSYGRGLLYFLDPLTYDTNVLPARLADPSMAIGYEGGSLVYGVSPTATPVSNNTNDLPVKSASYNLANTATGFRGTQEAVYVPIPDGYTLMLGAFYSKSGSGGIFASPRNFNGAIGAAVRLTELTGNSVNVVQDKFDGVAGVWIWLGKSASGPASVTANAMIGRLVQTSLSIPTIVENLFTNPNLVGDGTWAEVARFPTGSTPPVVVQPEDFRVRDLGTGESAMEIERVRGLASNNCVAGVSTKGGKPAVRLISTGANASFASFPIPPLARSSGTMLGTVHLDAAISGALSARFAALSAENPVTFTAPDPNTPGSRSKRLSFGPLTNFYQVRWYHGGTLGSGDVWWTDIGLFAGKYTGEAFSGDSPYAVWSGTPNNSTSIRTTYPSEVQEALTGPWIGGQGHSGCRFSGKPTYIEYGGVNGGQIGFAATFREVGSWAFG